MNLHEFWQNRLQFPPEKLEEYAGKYVAWRPDGKGILASDEDQGQLEATLKAAGYNPAEILVSSVPLPDEVILGGGGHHE